jgi:hypothetical protein
VQYDTGEKSPVLVHTNPSLTPAIKLLKGTIHDTNTYSINTTLQITIHIMYKEHCVCVFVYDVSWMGMGFA